jgi:hypothetical protein
MKISKQLRKYPISNYGGKKETEIYRKGFKDAIKLVKRIERTQSSE